MNYSVGGALNEAGDYENFSSSSPDEAEIGSGVQSSVLPSRVVTRQLPSQQQPVANSTVIHQTLHPNSPPRYYIYVFELTFDKHLKVDTQRNINHVNFSFF